RCAYFGHRDVAKVVAVFDKSGVELAKAPNTQVQVRGPTRRIERPPCRADGPRHIAPRRVGSNAEYLLGGGVDVLIDGAALRRHELTVDQEPIQSHQCVTFPTATGWSNRWSIETV